jgi:putative membrane protein
MKRLQKFIKHNPQQFAVFAAAFFLVLGGVQAALGLDYVLKLTPILLTLLASLAVVFWDAPVKTKLWASAIIITGGFVIEAIGVHTGLIFGDYSYGKLLGLTVFGVPITIGVTWLLVTYSAWNIVSLSISSLVRKFLLGGLLVVMFDLILEQFAISYSLWAWQGGIVPLYNYICWFVVSQLCFMVYRILTPKAEPSIFAVYVLPLMAAFFWFMLIIA